MKSEVKGRGFLLVTIQRKQTFLKCVSIWYSIIITNKWHTVCYNICQTNTIVYSKVLEVLVLVLPSIIRSKMSSFVQRLWFLKRISGYRSLTVSTLTLGDWWYDLTKSYRVDGNGGKHLCLRIIDKHDNEKNFLI